MCNINLISRRRKDTATSRAITCLNVMSYNSFQNNDDGCGFLIIKPDGYNVMRDPKLFKVADQNFRTAINHQRLATSGQGSDIHPIATKDLVVFHNGVFSGLGTKTESDTVVYANKLQAAYEVGGDIIEAIKEVHKVVDGSFSVVVYVPKTDRTYYYKNASTKMTGYFSSCYLVMSTAADNAKFAKWYLGMKDAQKIEFETYKIYDLDTLMMVGEIDFVIPEPPKAEPKGLVQSEWGSYYNYGDNDGMEERRTMVKGANGIWYWR